MKDILQRISKKIIRKQLTLAVAESVTAGLVLSRLSLANEAGLFLQGGVVVYNLGQKTKHLNVEPISSDKHNCVKQSVSDIMALNVASRFIADIGVGITGYASVLPEKGVESLYAYISIARHGRVIKRKKVEAAILSPEKVQEQYVVKTLELLETLL